MSPTVQDVRHQNAPQQPQQKDGGCGCSCAMAVHVLVEQQHNNHDKEDSDSPTDERELDDQDPFLPLQPQQQELYGHIRRVRRRAPQESPLARSVPGQQQQQQQQLQQQQDDTNTTMTPDHEDDDYHNNDNAQEQQRQHKAPAWIVAYTQCLGSRACMLLMLFFLLLLLWPAGFHALRLLQDYTDSTFHPVPGSQAARAQAAFSRVYHNNHYKNNDTHNANNNHRVADPVLQPPLILVLQSKQQHAQKNNTNNSNSNSNLDSLIDASSPAYQEAREFFTRLDNTLQSYCWKGMDNDNNNGNPQEPTNNSKNCSATTNNNYTNPIFWIRVTSYYSLQDEQLAWLADALTTQDGRMVMGQVEYQLPTASASALQPLEHRLLLRSLLQVVETFVKQENNRQDATFNDKSYFDVHLTGLPLFQHDLMTASKRDLIRMDTLVVPLALLLLGCVLPHARMWTVWIVPLVAILTTVAVWSLVALFIAYYQLLQMTQFTPNIMMSLSLGMGIDYTLFLLARYLEQRAHSQQQEQQRQQRRRLQEQQQQQPPQTTQPPASRTAENDMVTVRAGNRHGRGDLLSFNSHDDDDDATGHDNGNHHDTTTQSQKKNPDDCILAVAYMLYQGGHVVVLSGLTLATTFLGLTLLPLTMLKSMGVGASIAIVSCLAVNLVVVPAMLLSPIGNWIFKHPNNDMNASIDETTVTDRSSAENCVPSTDHHGISDHDGGSNTTSAGPSNEWMCDNSDHPLSTPLLANATTPVPHRTRIRIMKEPESIWYLMSKQLLHPYKGIIILLLTCQLLYPVAQYCTSMNSSIAFDLVLPTASPSLQTFYTLGKTLGWGRMTPYRILFDGSEVNITMTSRAGFDIMHAVLHELMAIDSSVLLPLLLDSRNISNGYNTPGETSPLLNDENENDILLEMLAKMRGEAGSDVSSMLETMQSTTETHVTSYNGIAILKNRPIPHSVFMASQYCSGMYQPRPCPVEFLHVLDTIHQGVTSQDTHATFVTATLAVNPFSDAGTQWLRAARGVLQRLQSDGTTLHGVQVYLEGSASIAHDAVDAVYSAIPTMLILTTVTVFVLMGVFFRSVFVPLRSIVSICLTLSFSFGASVLVYQRGILDWTHIRALTSLSVEVCWLVPVMAFSIVVGLALDYDVFLISRILEYRMEGYSHKSSIAAGLHSTGGIITAAGMIMSFAFGSLMLSSSPVLYQWSFLITTAVLLDTFLVRTMIVPILTNLAGTNLCWWPRCPMPPERIYLPGFEPVDTVMERSRRMSVRGDGAVTGIFHILEEQQEE